MAILPTRDSSDTNSAADINTLSEEAVNKTEAQTVNGVKTFGSFPVTPSSAPTTDYQVANKKYVDDNGGGGGGSTGITFYFKGNAYVGTKQAQVLMPASATISKVIAYADTAPTGADMQIDVNKNGTTIFTTQSKRPIIAAGTNTDDSDTPDVTALTQDDIVSIDVDQVGSTVVGGDDLMVTVVFS